MRATLTALLFCLALALAGAAWTHAPAWAGDQPASPFALRPPAAGQPPAAAPVESPRASPGLWRSFWNWTDSTLQQLHTSIGKHTSALGKDGSFEAGAILIGISFVYGVLHALGPGHGKMVIGSYVLANRQTIRRGVALSFASAFVQGLTATAIAVVMVLVVKATSMEIMSTVGALDSASHALIALTGLWLLYLTANRLWLQPRREARRRPAPDSAPHTHDHHHHEGAACSCGHAHVPDAAAVSGDLSPWRALSIVLAVGIRPCTGALIALVVALQKHIFLAGVIAVFANSLGTAITVSALMMMTVGSRDAAVAATGRESSRASRIYDFAAVAGALFLAAVGVTLFIASLGPQPAFLR